MASIRVQSGRGRSFLCTFDEGSSLSRCRFCGALIVWAETSKAKRIPLEPFPPDAHLTESHFGHCTPHRQEPPPPPPPPPPSPVEHSVPMSLRTWRQLILLVHPDKHPGNEELSNEITRWLIAQRKRLSDQS